MKIFCEDTLTYGEQFFSDVAHVSWFSGNKLQAEQLHEADALFIRSTTKVNEALLSDAPNLKLVATATSGSDHMDLNLLRDRNINAYAAGGCNAIAVAEYVICGLLHLAVTYKLNLTGKRIGIVGAGHVGTELAERARHLGLQVLLCDPPLQEAGDPREFVALEDILKCDVISLHVPFVKTGEWPTGHMLDEQRLRNLKPGQILVNACRGEVVDNKALYNILRQNSSAQSQGFFTIFDVWENEPAIDFELAKLTNIATQHIAGHSLEGKARGTEMIYNIAAKQFGWAPKSMWDYLPDVETEATLGAISDNGDIEQLHALTCGVYDINDDSVRFNRDVSDPEKFRYSRKNYAIRREFASVQLNAGNSPLSKAIYGLGFSEET